MLICSEINDKSGMILGYQEPVHFVEKRRTHLELLVKCSKLVQLIQDSI